jgi:hypothetical protein
MNSHTAAQLAEICRQELAADATYYRKARAHRGGTRSRLRRPISAFHGWLAQASRDPTQTGHTLMPKVVRCPSAYSCVA